MPVNPYNADGPDNTPPLPDWVIVVLVVFVLLVIWKPLVATIKEKFQRKDISD